MKENVVKLMMTIILMVLAMSSFSFAPPGNGDAGYFSKIAYEY